MRLIGVLTQLAWRNLWRNHRRTVIMLAAILVAATRDLCGIMLPDSYIRALAKATHSYGGLFVVDCIASGTTFFT